MLRRIACFTAATLILSAATLPANRAASRPLSKPLDLSQFMRSPEAAAVPRAGAAKQRRNARMATARMHHRRPASVDVRTPKPDPRERRSPALEPTTRQSERLLSNGAATAFAAQPAPEGANARDTILPLDTTINAADIGTPSAAETSASTVRVVDSGEFNEIDRKADEARADSEPTEALSPQSSQEKQPSGPDSADDASWSSRLWRMLKQTFATLADTVARLVG